MTSSRDDDVAVPLLDRWQRYDRMALHVLPAARHLLEVVGAPPGPERPQLLDIGTGTATALELAAALGWSPLGLDMSIDQLDEAAPTGAPLVLADGQRLPIRDDAVDAVISNFALIFATRPEVVLHDARRCLAPRRRCAWSAWCPGGWPNSWRTLLAHALGRDASPFPVSLGVEDTARAAMLAAGFTDVSIERRSVSWLVADPEDAVATITAAAGGLRPLVSAVESAGRWPDVSASLVADAERRARPTADGIAIDDEYLAVVGRTP
ncbi:MAG: methyltransferase domain-containing protein [Actinomycetota bacterium]